MTKDWDNPRPHICKFDDRGHCVKSILCDNVDPSRWVEKDRSKWDYSYCQRGDPHCVSLCDCTPPLLPMSSPRPVYRPPLWLLLAGAALWALLAWAAWGP